MSGKVKKRRFKEKFIVNPTAAWSKKNSNVAQTGRSTFPSISCTINGMSSLSSSSNSPSQTQDKEPRVASPSSKRIDRRTSCSGSSSIDSSGLSLVERTGPVSRRSLGGIKSVESKLTSKRRKSFSGLEIVADRKKSSGSKDSEAGAQYWRCALCLNIFNSEEKFLAHQEKPHTFQCQEKESCKRKFVCFSDRLKHHYQGHNVKRQLFRCNMCQELIDRKSKGAHLKRCHEVECPEENCPVVSNKVGIWAHRILQHNHGVCMNEPALGTEPPQHLAVSVVEEEEIEMSDDDDYFIVPMKGQTEGYENSGPVEKTREGENLHEEIVEVTVAVTDPDFVAPEFNRKTKEAGEFDNTRLIILDSSTEDPEDFQPEKTFLQELEDSDVLKPPSGLHDYDEIDALLDSDPEDEDPTGGWLPLKKPEEKSPVSCPECQFVYKEKEYRAHLMMNHSFHCDFCPRSFTSAIRLGDHTSSVHPLGVQNRSCSQCDMSFKREKALTTHLRKEHPVQCPECHLKFTGEVFYEKHFKSIHSINRSTREIKRSRKSERSEKRDQSPKKSLVKKMKVPKSTVSKRKDEKKSQEVQFVQFDDLKSTVVTVNSSTDSLVVTERGDSDILPLELDSSVSSEMREERFKDPVGSSQSGRPREARGLGSSEVGDVTIADRGETGRNMESSHHHELLEHKFHCHHCPTAFVTSDHFGDHLKSEHGINQIRIGGTYSHYLTYERSDANKLVIGLVLEWIYSEEAKALIQDVMAGTFPSTRHQLFLKPKERKRVSVLNPTLLHQLSNQGFLTDSEVNDSVVLERLMEIFSSLFEHVSNVTLSIVDVKIFIILV